MDEEIQALEERIRQLEDTVRRLKEENRRLKEKRESYEQRGKDTTIPPREARKQRKKYISQIRREAAKARWSKERANAEANNLKSNLECNEEDIFFEAVFKAYEEKRTSCEEKVEALRAENDATIREENDAVDAEENALIEERNAIMEECNALIESLKGCNGNEIESHERNEKFTALDERRKAFNERFYALDERRKTLFDRVVNFLAESAINLQEECYALKEEVALLDEIREAFKEANYGEYKRRMPEFTRERLKGVSFVNREAEIIGSKLNDREAYIANHEGERNANAEGVVLTQEAWKVIDENWEELKDAVYKMKVRKEKTPYVRLPMEGWKVLDKYFDELVKLFHI